MWCVLPFSFDPPNTKQKEDAFVIRQIMVINNTASVSIAPDFTAHVNFTL